MKKTRSLKFAVGSALVGLGLTGCPGEEKDAGPTINVAPVPEETPAPAKPDIIVNTVEVPPEKKPEPTPGD